MSVWFYMKSGILEDSQMGPVADSTFLELAYDGTLKPKTIVCSPVHTKGQWVQLSQIPAARIKYEQGIEDRKKQKEQQSQDRQIAKAEAKQATIQEASERQHALPFAHLLMDGQPQAVLEKIWDKVTQFMVPGEDILYIAVQAKPLMVAPDCVVLTNRRFLVLKQSLLGGLQFSDFFWLNLHNATVKEGMMFSDFTVATSTNQRISIDYLPKAQARAAYRLAQAKEEEMRELRRTRQMEETRAGTSSIVVNAQPQITQTATPAPMQSVAADDPVEKLAKLKRMVEAGLIEKSEYETTKKRILEAM